MFLIVLLGFVVTATPNLFAVVCSQSYPSNVLVPSTFINNTDVPLSCTGADPVQWRVNGTTFNPGSSLPGLGFMVVNDGSMITQTLTVQQAFVLSYNGTAFQCSTNGEDFSSVSTAHIIVYGKVIDMYTI